MWTLIYIIHIISQPVHSDDQPKHPPAPNTEPHLLPAAAKHPPTPNAEPHSLPAAAPTKGTRDVPTLLTTSNRSGGWFLRQYVRQQAASSAPITHANTKNSKREVTFGPPTCVPPEESGFHADEPAERRTKRARTRPHPSTKHKKKTSPATVQKETPSDQPPTQRKRAALLGTTTAARPPKKPRSQVHASLASYDATHGTQHTETRGK